MRTRPAGLLAITIVIASNHGGLAMRTRRCLCRTGGRRLSDTPVRGPVGAADWPKVVMAPGELMDAVWCGVPASGTTIAPERHAIGLVGADGDRLRFEAKAQAEGRSGVRGWPPFGRAGLCSDAVSATTAEASQSVGDEFRCKATKASLAIHPSQIHGLRKSKPASPSESAAGKWWTVEQSCHAAVGETSLSAISSNSCPGG